MPYLLRRAYEAAWKRSEQRFKRRVLLQIGAKLENGEIGHLGDLQDGLVAATIKSASFPIARSARFEAAVKELVPVVAETIAGAAEAQAEDGIGLTAEREAELLAAWHGR